MNRQDMRMRGKRIDFPGPPATLVLLVFLFLACPLLHAASATPADTDDGSSMNNPAAEKQAEEAGPILVAIKEKTSDDEYGDVTEKDAGPAPATVQNPSDEYGNVTEETAGGGEEMRIADPVEPWNRAMYHVNDKLYFWLLKPAAKGYKYAMPEDVRGIFSNFYENLKAPIRIINNLLQGKPRYAGIELSRFLINSTVGVAGLRDCAKECFGIGGRNADFGQTLGKYGFGFGFYIVWPILGPSSPRDTVGLVGDRMLTPTSYISSEWMSPESTGLSIHEKINYTSFHIGDYEAIKGAAIDPYIAMRDAYVQYRKKTLEQ
jgi:phospholipid-binding lipoprotein MlaA